MKIVIVGAGLLGLLTARELVQAGCDVIMLDQSAPGRESSWAGGGILSPLYPWRYPDAVNQLAFWSQHHYPQLVQELIEDGGMDPQWTNSGMLVLDTGEEPQITEFIERFPAPVEKLDARQLSEIEPGLSHDFASGALFPAIAHIRNPRLVKSLLTSCSQRGVEFLPNCRVSGFVQQAGRVTGVQTSTGQVEGDAVLVASGAWSGDLLAEIGVVCPIRPVKGQMLLYRGIPGQIEHIVLNDGHYVIPRRDGRVLVGSTLEEGDFDKSVSAKARDELGDFGNNLFPYLADMVVEQHWAGLRPGQPGSIPYISEVPGYSGLYLNAGHFRNGVVLGPASARLMADIMLDREPLFPPDLYGINREIC